MVHGRNRGARQQQPSEGRRRPSAALFGAILLVPTMIGAAAANLFLGQSPAVPLVLLLVAVAVAWSRRNQLQDVFSN